MSTSQSAYSVSAMSPPADLGSYARTMHQHTKRQMEAISPPSSSSAPPRSNNSRESPSPTGLPNGVQQTTTPRSRNSSECSYQG